MDAHGDNGPGDNGPGDDAGDDAGHGYGDDAGHGHGDDAYRYANESNTNESNKSKVTGKYNGNLLTNKAQIHVRGDVHGADANGDDANGADANGDDAHRDDTHRYANESNESNKSKVTGKHNGNLLTNKLQVHVRGYVHGDDNGDDANGDDAHRDDAHGDAHRDANESNTNESKESKVTGKHNGNLLINEARTHVRGYDHGADANGAGDNGKVVYVYHLNVHNMAANQLKLTLDYDYEDDRYDHVLVKHGTQHSQPHRKNMYNVVRLGYIIFDISNAGYYCGHQWQNHYMILPRCPYPHSDTTGNTKQ